MGERRPRTRTIRTDYLARVEGEGAMHVRLTGDRVDEIELRIYEPPRFFEALLRGRDFREAPDITSRICGICPVAYQLSAAQAMEEICGARVDGQLRALRRLLYCGEWLESHALHVFMLHLPDFLGYESAVHMARDHGPLVESALALKKTGNAVMTVVGGREVHPVNVKVGGFHRAPRKPELAPLREQLERARETAVAAVGVVAGLDFPDYQQDVELVALAEDGLYPIDRGRLVSDRGLDIPLAAWNDTFVEEHVARSNALHARLRARGTYLVGPLARYALASHLLSPVAREAAAAAGLGAVCRNPFQSIVVRCVELLYACDEAIGLIDAYEEPDRPDVPLEIQAGVGHGATEAPRGVCYHRYEIDGEGTILDAQIVPPTSQNQRAIEDDLRGVVERSLDLPDKALGLLCEQTIRNYDPCISCATHFLDLTVERQVSTLVVGVGNEWRGDDGVGLVVAERLAAEGVHAVALGGEPAALVDALGAADAVVVVDGVRSGGGPGALVRWDAGVEPLPLGPFRGSTHALGVAEAVELARALGRLAPRVVVYGIEIADTAVGAPLSPPVERAVAAAVEAVLGELRVLERELERERERDQGRRQGQVT